MHHPTRLFISRFFNSNERCQKTQRILPLALSAVTKRSYASYQELRENHDSLIKQSRVRNPKDVARHVEVNKKQLIWDRINGLLDPNSAPLELSPLAGNDLSYGTIPNAGTISLLGQVSGVTCLLLGNDATCKGGTTFPINLHKTLRGLRISMQNRIPIIHITDSGGAFLPLQAEIFPDANHGGRMFRNQAVISSMRIPQIALVCGSCTAGGAYIPSMSDEAVIVEGIGTIFLAGPALVKAATGEITSANELGGATLHSTISGGTDYYCTTENESFTLIRKLVSNLNIGSHEMRDDVSLEPSVSIESVVGGYMSRSNTGEFPIMDVIAALTDKSDLTEFKSLYGRGILTCFASIHSYPVGIVANNGTMDSAEALKATHFVQLCNQRKIPLLFIVNLTASPPSRSHHIKEQSALIQSITQANIPKITLVVGESCYPQSYAMCSRSFDPNFLFTWPTSIYSFPDGTKRDAYYGSARLWDDGVLLPTDTRRVLAQALFISQAYTSKEILRKEQKFIRM